MDSPSFLPSFLNMIFALAVVLGLFIGTMVFFRKILQRTGSGWDEGSAITVLTVRYLGPKSSIMVVDVLGTVIVIGLTGNQMTHLSTITEPQALERLKNLGRREKGGRSFNGLAGLTPLVRSASARFRKNGFGK